MNEHPFTEGRCYRLKATGTLCAVDNSRGVILETGTLTYLRVGDRVDMHPLGDWEIVPRLADEYDLKGLVIIQVEGSRSFAVGNRIGVNPYEHDRVKRAFHRIGWYVAFHQSQKAGNAPELDRLNHVEARELAAEAADHRYFLDQITLELKEIEEAKKS